MLSTAKTAQFCTDLLRLLFDTKLPSICLRAGWNTAHQWAPIYAIEHNNANECHPVPSSTGQEQFFCSVIVIGTSVTHVTTVNTEPAQHRQHVSIHHKNEILTIDQTFIQNKHYQNRCSLSNPRFILCPSYIDKRMCNAEWWDHLLHWEWSWLAVQAYLHHRQVITGAYSWVHYYCCSLTSG